LQITAYVQASTRSPQPRVARMLSMYWALCGAESGLRLVETQSMKLHDAQAVRLYENGVHLVQAITVLRSPQALYAVWRDVRNIPRILRQIEEVTVIDNRTSRWTVRTPGGIEYSWTSEVINDRSDELIAWRSIGEADTENAGSIHFRALPRGTEVRIVIEYVPPGDTLGSSGSAFELEASALVGEALQRLRQLAESESGPFAGQTAPRPTADRCRVRR